MTYSPHETETHRMVLLNTQQDGDAVKLHFFSHRTTLPSDGDDDFVLGMFVYEWEHHPGDYGVGVFFANSEAIEDTASEGAVFEIFRALVKVNALSLEMAVEKGAPLFFMSLPGILKAYEEAINAGQ